MSPLDDAQAEYNSSTELQELLTEAAASPSILGKRTRVQPPS